MRVSTRVRGSGTAVVGRDGQTELALLAVLLPWDQAKRALDLVPRQRLAHQGNLPVLLITLTLCVGPASFRVVTR